MKPLTGWPKDIFPALIQFLDSIVDHKSVKKFRIGRSVDPSQRASLHGGDDTFAIYFTDSVDNAIAIESTLIETFYTHPKCVNRAPHGGGGITEEQGNYVYVAIWF